MNKKGKKVRESTNQCDDGTKSGGGIAISKNLKGNDRALRTIRVHVFENSDIMASENYNRRGTQREQHAKWSISC